MKLKEQAKNLKQTVPAIFLCLKDRRTPIAAKIFAAITVGYVLSPVDLIPDFIPILGYLDDLIILPLLAAITIKLIPNEILESNIAKAEELWQNDKPKKWYYAIPMITFWLIIIGIIIKAILF